MREAMKGQASFDNKEAAYLGRSSTAFQLWSEMAGLKKNCQDWSQTKDPKAIQDNLDVAIKKKKMNDAVMSMMRAAIQSGSPIIGHFLGTG